MCPLFPNHHHPPGLAPTAHRARAVRRSGARHKADPCSTPQNLSGGLLRASRGLDTDGLLIFGRIAGWNQTTAGRGACAKPKAKLTDDLIVIACARILVARRGAVVLDVGEDVVLAPEVVLLLEEVVPTRHVQGIVVLHVCLAVLVHATVIVHAHHAERVEVAAGEGLVHAFAFGHVEVEINPLGAVVAALLLYPLLGHVVAAKTWRVGAVSVCMACH